MELIWRVGCQTIVQQQQPILEIKMPEQDDLTTPEQDDLTAAISKIKNGLENAVKLLASRLPQPTVPINSTLVTQLSSHLATEMQISPQSKRQPLPEETMITAAVVAYQALVPQLSNQETVTNVQVKAAFKAALKTVNAQQSQNIKIGTHRTNATPQEKTTDNAKPNTSLKMIPRPAKNSTPRGKIKIEEKLGRPKINIAAKLGSPPERTPQPPKHKEIELEKVVLAAMAAIGSASPAAGAGMVGTYLINKHGMPEKLKKGKTNIAVKVAGAAAAIAVPAGLVGVVAESNRTNITARLNTAANNLRDSGTIPTAAQAMQAVVPTFKKHQETQKNRSSKTQDSPVSQAPKNKSKIKFSNPFKKKP
jgi:hypothetical protein